jgi:hypothetical protein
MPKANADPNTSPEPADECGRTNAQQPEIDEAAAVSRWPLGDIEPELQDLRAAAGLLSHVAASPHQIEPEELVSLAGQIIANHDRLKAPLAPGVRCAAARTRGAQGRAGRRPGPHLSRWQQAASRVRRGGFGGS